MPTKNTKTYCDFVKGLDKNNLHRVYHDTEYGFPIADDNELFGRLILEINQAGLSWDTILKKEENFRRAYEQFNINKIASFKEVKKQKLLSDTGIIRNRLKIEAAVYNAQQILELQKEYDSFKKWLEAHRGLTKEEWVNLFKKTFKFTGEEIAKEFLMSTGYLPGAHKKTCPIYKKTL